MLPRISLITPSYQQAAFLEECLASVHAQQYDGLEHIVVDGGSTDGSTAIIERYTDRFAWWCSEEDDGQSDAINKGLRHASGEVFGWLNSDDVLLPGALRCVGAAFAKDPSLLVLTGVRKLREAGKTDRAMELDDPSSPEDLFVSPRINQQSTFFRMSAVREVGGLEARLRCVMDLELWWQMLFRYGTGGVRVMPAELAVFRAHGDSKTTKLQQVFLDETASMLHQLCVRTGSKELAAVLAIGHDIDTRLRAFPVDIAQHERVQRMTVRFLLKWHHAIYTERDFSMMKAFRSMSATLPPLNGDQQESIVRIDDQLRAGSWFSFRLRRKWKHLVG